MTEKTRTTVIAVVTGVWATNFLASLVPFLKYESDQAINGIFMTIVGGLFALGARAKAQEGAEEPPELEPPEEEPPEVEEVEDEPEPAPRPRRQPARRPRRARPTGTPGSEGADSPKTGEDVGP